MDAGAIIELDRKPARLAELLAASDAEGRALYVPAVALAEWWRDVSYQRYLRRALRTVEITETMALRAGEALARLRGGRKLRDNRRLTERRPRHGRGKRAGQERRRFGRLHV